MPRNIILVLSDVHYASPAEQVRTHHETRYIANPILRIALKLYRHYIWLRDPLGQNHLLDRFLDAAPSEPLAVVANGDFSCDTAFVGVSDDAARESVELCLQKLRSRFGSGLRTVIGDHELGKISMFGNVGGLRLASWSRVQELGFVPFWQKKVGCWRLIGITSSLVALPVYEPETLRSERAAWNELRSAHWQQIRTAFDEIRPDEKVILFCHDPSALPFLGREPAIRRRLDQLEATIIGHLHSPLLLWKSRWLAGMPAIGFLGNTVRRLTTALRDAREWRQFKVTLCPSLAGLELLKDGGYLTLELDSPTPNRLAIRRFHLPR